MKTLRIFCCPISFLDHKDRPSLDAEVITPPEYAMRPGKLMTFAEDFLSLHTAFDVWLFTESEIVFNSVRLAIKKGKIDPSIVRVTHISDAGVVTHLTFDADGRIQGDIPKGFYDHVSRQLEQLL